MRRLRTLLAEETEDAVRLQLTIELCRAEEGGAIGELVAVAAGSHCPRLRRRAAWALAELPDQAVGPVLLNVLEDGGREVAMRLEFVILRF